MENEEKVTWVFTEYDLEDLKKLYEEREEGYNSAFILLTVKRYPDGLKMVNHMEHKYPIEKRTNEVQ